MGWIRIVIQIFIALFAVATSSPLLAINCLLMMRDLREGTQISSVHEGRLVFVAPSEKPIVEKKLWLHQIFQPTEGGQEFRTGDGAFGASLRPLPEALTVKSGQTLTTNVVLTWREGEVEQATVELYQGDELIGGLRFALDTDPKTNKTEFLYQSGMVYNPDAIKSVFQFPFRAKELLSFQASKHSEDDLDREPDLRRSIQSMSNLMPSWIFRPLLANVNSTASGDRRVQMQVTQFFEGGREVSKASVSMDQILPGAGGFSQIVPSLKMRPLNDGASSSVEPKGGAVAVDVLVHRVRGVGDEDPFETAIHAEPLYNRVSRLPKATTLLHSVPIENFIDSDDSLREVVGEIQTLAAVERTGDHYDLRFYEHWQERASVDIREYQTRLKLTVNGSGKAKVELVDSDGRKLARLAGVDHVLDLRRWSLPKDHPTFGFQSSNLDFQTGRGFVSRLPFLDNALEESIRALGRQAAADFEAKHLRP